MNTQTRSLRSAAAAACLALIAACATTSSTDIRVHSAPNAEFASFGSFGFPEQTGTDRGGYSTLVTNYFKLAVREQMEQRGYRFVEENPDLLVNFFANAREQTEVRSSPGPSHGYYGYRDGLYNTWPLYEQEVETVSYPIGTANIDVVDAKRKAMIWEGVAAGRIAEADLNRPEDAIKRTVAELFQRFPGRASAVDSTPRSASDTPD